MYGDADLAAEWGVVIPALVLVISHSPDISVRILGRRGYPNQACSGSWGGAKERAVALVGNCGGE